MMGLFIAAVCGWMSGAEIQSRGGSPSDALFSCTGAEFDGGAKDIFGTDVEGEQVNCVYARPTGKASSMGVQFEIASLGSEPHWLYLKARDDDGAGHCRITLILNGDTVFEGENSFAQDKFETRRFRLRSGVLKVGTNTLVIRNDEPEGRLGFPPWFQVAMMAVAGENFKFGRDWKRNFYVEIPQPGAPFPEPFPGSMQPGFKWRGTKGWAWRPAQYLAEIPWLARFKMNFLMNCYLSMFDIEHERDWFSGRANRWWEDLPAEKKSAYEEVVRSCQRHGIEFCFSMNPNLASQRIVNDGSIESIDQLFKHYAWMQSLGVKWFNISLDDISLGVDASSQARVVNEIFRRLRSKDPNAQMIFCPTFYWGDGTLTNQLGLGLDQRPYLETLARELDKEVFLFWTGDGVVGKITRKAAESFRRFSGHRLFLWDNYPVNDNQPTLHLGPVIGRDADLCKVVDGYMSNPHCTQNRINRIPLATCADYAYNPRAYDPLRSIGHAILLLADTRQRQEVLVDLVEAYPGMLVFGRNNTGFNAARERFNQLRSLPHSRPLIRAYANYFRELCVRLARELPDLYEDVRAVLDADLRFFEQQLRGEPLESNTDKDG